MTNTHFWVRKRTGGKLSAMRELVPVLLQKKKQQLCYVPFILRTLSPNPLTSPTAELVAKKRIQTIQKNGLKLRPQVETCVLSWLQRHLYKSYKHFQRTRGLQWVLIENITAVGLLTSWITPPHRCSMSHVCDVVSKPYWVVQRGSHVIIITWVMQLCSFLCSCWRLIATCIV